MSERRTDDRLDPVVRAWYTGQEMLLEQMSREAREARDKWAEAGDQRMRDYWQNVATGYAVQALLPYPDNAAWDQDYWEGYTAAVRAEHADRLRKGTKP